MNRSPLALPLLLIAMAILDLIALSAIEHSTGNVRSTALPFKALMLGQLSVLALWSALSELEWWRRYPPLAALLLAFVCIPEPGFGSDWPLLAMQAAMACAAGWSLRLLGLRWRALEADEPDRPLPALLWQLSLSQLFEGIAILAGMLELVHQVAMSQGRFYVSSAIGWSLYLACVAVLTGWAILGVRQRRASHGVLLAVLGTHACVASFIDRPEQDWLALTVLFVCAVAAPLGMLRRWGHRLTEGSTT